MPSVLVDLNTRQKRCVVIARDWDSSRHQKDVRPTSILHKTHINTHSNEHKHNDKFMIEIKSIGFWPNSRRRTYDIWLFV